MSHLSLVVPRPAPHDGPANDRTSSRLSAIDLLEALLPDERAAFAHVTEPPPADAAAFAAEVARASAELLAGERGRDAVRLAGTSEQWELGLERVGAALLVSFFSSGDVPIVPLAHLSVPAEAWRARLLAWLERAGASSARALLGWARARLLELDGAAAAGPAPPEPLPVPVEPTGDLPIVISAELSLRAGLASAAPSAQRAELLPLLFRGNLSIRLGEHVRSLGGAFVFVVAERLLALAAEALSAHERGRAYNRLECAGDVLVGLRADEGGAALTLRGTARRRGMSWTFPVVDLASMCGSVVAFGRALARALVRRDRSFAANLRLSTFRERVRELAARLREGGRDESLVNASPESYRAYFEGTATSPRREASPSRLQYAPRWTAGVAGLDLRSTFLCGDALVACGARDIGVIDARSGVEAWRRPAPRAASIVTPLGLARLEPGGRLTLHDLHDGEARWSRRLLPRSGGSPTGLAVAAPGLPKLLVVAEGARALTAMDLDSGAPRWRFVAERGASFRLRRVGRLLVVAGGDRALTALDVVSGDVVWRLCDPSRFSSSVAVGRGELFAFAGEGAALRGGSARLYEVDAWTGAPRRRVELPTHVSPLGAPFVSERAVLVVSHDRRGTSVLGLDRETLEPVWERLASSAAASCLLVDDTLVVNSEAGDVTGLDAATGAVRFRHVLPSGADGDRPRRLEPVLRSGALFVPQTEVHVIRPRDGAPIARITTDIVPDFVRVDDKCGVVVAEESGHLAAYGAAVRLSVV